MPINTNTNSDPPDVEVEVNDDPGPGNRRRHTADVLISWDPKLLKCVRTRPKRWRCHVDQKGGHALWMKAKIPNTPNGKSFSVRLKCRKRGSSWIVATATDCDLGQGHTSKVRFKCKKKAGKKKATKKKAAKRKAGKKKATKAASKKKAAKRK